MRIVRRFLSASVIRLIPRQRTTSHRQRWWGAAASVAHLA
jgi:hypothetical protein